MRDGIEARSGETRGAGLDPKDESPVTQSGTRPNSGANLEGAEKRAREAAQCPFSQARHHYAENCPPDERPFEKAWANYCDGPRAHAHKAIFRAGWNALAALQSVPEAGEALASDWREACDYLDHYAEYIRSVPSSELERHPYLPALERVAGSMRAALAAQPSIRSQAIEECARVAEVKFRELTKQYQKPADKAAMVAFDIATALRSLNNPGEVGK